jgi:hypothetical protein
MIRFAMACALCVPCMLQSNGFQSSGSYALAEAAPPQAAPSETTPASVGDAPADASFILPGTFSQRTTVADLEARFGKANVRIVEARDGTLARSVVLFADDPSRRAYVDFHDAIGLEGLRAIVVRDAGSRWRGKQGVHVGMSLADLRERNGKPFWFTGFDDQRRGWARDQWSPALDGDDGSLGALDVGEGEHMYFGVELGLRGAAKDLPVDAYPHDDSVSSDDPRYPRLGELVGVTAIDATTSLDDEWE